RTLKGTPRSIEDRLAEFYSRLANLPAPGTADEALEQVATTLDAVEDDWSGVPKKTPPPPPNMPDGRMYPPLPDRIVHHADGSLTARTKGHIIEVGAKGSVTFRRKKTGVIEYTREGRDT